MASTKILDAKKEIVNNIVNNIKNSESVILFQYQGLTVADLSELRVKLREADATVKVYKNTLLKRALDELNINFEGFLEGPNADFAKDHEKLEIRVGIISGSVADLATINEYASIPSREGLLTMLAAGMMEHVRNLSIALNLYAEGKEEN